MLFRGQNTTYRERYLECEHCGNEQTDVSNREVPKIPRNKCRKTQEAR